MKIVMLFGKNSSALHGPFEPSKLYEGRALTGSESSFFNIARGLRFRGHEVTVYCDTSESLGYCLPLLGASVHSIDTPIRGDYDACLSLNEPDLFRELPAGRFNVVCHQYNDFNNSVPGFDKFVDAYAFLSPLHADHVAIHTKEVSREKVTWIPNSLIPVPAVPPPIERKPHTAIWCSSPDRGLHRLLEMWPLVRKRVPDATLEIYYRIDPWLERTWENNSKLGVRANYIKQCLKILGRNGENGVHVVGPIPNLVLWQKLLGAGVLPYTCECVTFTEGFSVSIMDACRAGCVPIISDADAIGDIYKGAAHVIESKPNVIAVKDQWVEAITRAMLDSQWATEIEKRCMRFAESFEAYGEISLLWERLIQQNIGEKYRHGTPNLSGMPTSIAEFAASAASTASEKVEATKGAEAGRPEEKIQEKGEDKRVTTIQPISPNLRIAILLGSISKSVHGIFNIDDIYERGQAMTGTGSNFFNLVWGLAERGHTIDAFTDLKENKIECKKLGGAHLYNRESVTIGQDYDAYISVNEPDLLRQFPDEKLKILQMQLNDFSYAQAGFDRHVDYYVCPSNLHARFLADAQGLKRDKVIVLPLSINAEFFETSIIRQKGRMVYCSSPDRGLHHMIKIFPMVRAEIPEATLHVYYQTRPWIDQILENRHHPAEMRKRASIIDNGLRAMGEDGRSGLFLHGPVPTRTMATELQKAHVLAYPCDTVYFTEGFSVSLMDACAAGCFPISSDADALPDVYTGAIKFVRGKPEERYREWTDAIIQAMTNTEYANEVRSTARTFAMQHTRQKIAMMWETLIRERKKQ